MIALNINGQPHQVDVDPEAPLLWVIREWVGMTGTKYGCGIAQCGACSVHIDSQVMRSCSVPAGSVRNGMIVTIEGLAGRPEPSRAEGVVPARLDGQKSEAPRHPERRG